MPWFHGFVDFDQTNDLLRSQPIGTFILRFSSSAPTFSLSIKINSEDVGHWRITSHFSGEAPSYQFDKVTFKYFAEIVERLSAQENIIVVNMPSGKVNILLDKGLVRVPIQHKSSPLLLLFNVQLSSVISEHGTFGRAYQATHDRILVFCKELLMCPYNHSFLSQLALATNCTHPNLVKVQSDI
jgi:hypothetical protein